MGKQDVGLGQKIEALSKQFGEAAITTEEKRWGILRLSQGKLSIKELSDSLFRVTYTPEPWPSKSNLKAFGSPSSLVADFKGGRRCISRGSGAWTSVSGMLGQLITGKDQGAAYDLVEAEIHKAYEHNIK